MLPIMTAIKTIVDHTESNQLPVTIGHHVLVLTPAEMLAPF
jgi:hypothetical protein